MTPADHPIHPAHIADIFRRAADANLQDPALKGCVLHMPRYGQIVMTGDLHGHFKNFEKLQRFAMLDRAGARHVVLHEMIHQDVPNPADDLSHRLLLLAARYKLDFPEQVHFIQSNHELAQLTDYPIAKNGRVLCDEFRENVLRDYGPAHAIEILDAMYRFMASFALAIRTPNRVWMSHSLPDASAMSDFDLSLFDRPIDLNDLRTSSTIHQLVWGRRQSKSQVLELAARLDVDWFITGHQPQDAGHAVLFDRLIILASDHNHGAFLPFDLAKPTNITDLTRAIRKFVAVA